MSPNSERHEMTPPAGGVVVVAPCSIFFLSQTRRLSIAWNDVAVPASLCSFTKSAPCQLHVLTLTPPADVNEEEFLESAVFAALSDKCFLLANGTGIVRLRRSGLAAHAASDLARQHAR